MEDFRFLNDIRQIDPNNEFICYIIDRVTHNDYRGIQCSQHNRLTPQYFRILIETIYEVAGNEKFNIHVGDDDGIRQPGCEKYYDIVNLVNIRAGKGTINSIKKNTFPDIEKMGFISRYDRNDEIISVGGNRRGIHSVKLSDLGLQYIESKAFEKIKIFTDGVDRLTNFIGSEIAEILDVNDYGIEHIDILEFMYIISDDRISVSQNDKLRYILEYRRLSDLEKERLHQNLKNFCDPANRRGHADKTLLRDYSNWKNESQQIYGLFTNSAYFRVQENRLILNTGNLGLFNTDTRRGNKGKRDYLIHHNLSSHPDYNHHHIIPFSKANNQKDLLDIDDFKNLIYLCRNKHDEFTRQGSGYVKMQFDQSTLPKILFTNFDQGFIIVDITSEAMIRSELLPDMKKHNEFLLRKYYYI